MALSMTAMLLLGGAGIVLFMIILYFLSRYMDVDFFGSMSSMTKRGTPELVKTQVIPDDEMYRVINAPVNFNELVSGYKEVGKDERTGLTLIQFRYGGDKLTNWSVPFHPDFFRINTKKNLAGKRPLEYIITEPSDVILRMRNELANTSMYAKGLQNTVKDLSEDEKLRSQKTIEFQREQRRVAFGQAASGTGGSGSPFFSPWRRPWQGGGGGGMEGGDEGSG